MYKIYIYPYIHIHTHTHKLIHTHIDAYTDAPTKNTHINRKTHVTKKH